MQEQGHRHLSSRSRWRQYGSSSPGFQTDSDFSQASTTSRRSDVSTNFNKRSMSGSSRSIRLAAKEVAGSCITCFIPFSRKSLRGDVHADIPEESATNNNPRFRYRSSSDVNNAYKEISKFSIEDIYKATGDFSASNKIGEGHFGTIYKGKLKDGSTVAVKRAKKTNAYEKHVSDEFKNEIKTLSNIEHLNLVRFQGFLEQDDERIIVVEYVDNGNLREHLNGLRGERLGIAERLQIAIDVAHAVTYLHTYADHPIIHRDIKASNILITEKLRAKVADFGFARLAADDPEATHVVTQVKGTAGYLDPEYLKTYQLTEKSDVYSFGVLLVELVTGRRPIEPKRPKERMTTIWAMKLYSDGDTVIAMDPRLRRSPVSIMVVEKMLGLAKQCIAPSRRSRPSMKTCAEILWEIRRKSQKLEASTSEDLLSHTTAKQDSVSSSSHQKEHEGQSSSSSLNWELEVVREGAAWDVQTPPAQAHQV